MEEISSPNIIRCVNDLFTLFDTNIRKNLYNFDLGSATLGHNREKQLELMSDYWMDYSNEEDTTYQQLFYTCEPDTGCYS